VTPINSRRGLRLVIVGDQAITRSALAVLLRGEEGIDAVHDADGALSAMRLVAAGAVDAVLVVFATSAGSVEAVDTFIASGLRVPILVLAVDAQPAFVRRVLASGAHGVLTTDTTPDEVVDAMQTLVRGVPYVQADLGALLAAQEPLREIDALSSREREVLRLIALGYTNPQIAEQLVVSVRTIETHRAHVAKKLDAGSRADLVRHALQEGLLGDRV
jgi:two-component system response regulator NreC